MPTKTDRQVHMHQPHRISKTSKPYPSPEPSFFENIPLRELWNSAINVSSQADRLPNVDPVKRLSGPRERPGTVQQHYTYKPNPGGRKWKSQNSLVNYNNNKSTDQPQSPKQPKLSPGLPQRSKTFYVSNDKTVHISMEKMMISVAGYNNNHNHKKDERLPVVELKPFISSTKKEWVISKSRAWEEDFGVHHSPPPYITRSAEYFHHSGYPDPQKLDTPRPSESICSKAFPVTGERKSVHPKTKDVADGTIIQREVSFVPKPEREKTTTEEIRHQTMYNQYPPFSFVSRELTEYDIRKQQLMRVYGQKVDKLPPENNMYMNTWQVYKQSSAKANVKHGEQPVQHVQQIENTYLDENIYDYFDRSVTLPSITVKATGNKLRRTKSNKEMSSDRNNNRPGYRLGVVNSLDIMSMCGKPLKIEQNLTNHLKITLEKLKRTKETSIVQTGSSGSNQRHHVSKMDVVGIPTIGEMMLKEARKSNSYAGSQSAPVKRSKSLKSNSDYNLQSRATTYCYDSGFEGSSNDRKSTTSPTKSLNRNSRMQMHQVITEDVKEGNSTQQRQQRQKSGLTCNSLASQAGEPVIFPNEQTDKADDSSSVSDSVDITQSGRSVRSYPKDSVQFNLTETGPADNEGDSASKRERKPSKGSLRNRVDQMEQLTDAEQHRENANETQQPIVKDNEQTVEQPNDNVQTQQPKDNAIDDKPNDSVKKVEQPKQDPSKLIKPKENVVETGEVIINEDSAKNKETNENTQQSEQLSDNVQQTQQPSEKVEQNEQPNKQEEENSTKSQEKVETPLQQVEPVSSASEHASNNKPKDEEDGENNLDQTQDNATNLNLEQQNNQSDSLQIEDLEVNTMNSEDKNIDMVSAENSKTDNIIDNNESTAEQQTPAEDTVIYEV